MLLKIREIVTGWLAAAIIALLIVPFAFWGINYYFGNNASVSAVEVNGTPISLMEYQRAHQTIRQRFASTFGGSLPEDQEPVVRQNTIDSLVDRELVRQVNDELGVRVGDMQLTEVILAQQQFQGVNGFDTYIYENFLSQMGYTRSGFEDQMRRDMEAVQLQGGIFDSAFVTEEQKNRVLRIINQERDFTYGVISSNELKDSIEVTEDEITNHYNEFISDYMNPEQVRIAYVDLSLRGMAAELQVSEADLRNYYDENSELYNVEDQRKFKHLFVALDEDASEGDIAEFTADLQAIREQVTNGKAIQEAVIEIRGEGDTSMELIDQDYITRGIMEPEIDNALFAMNIGDVSEPIRTEFGLNLLYLETIRGGLTSDFETVREQVEEDYTMSEVEPVYVDYLDRMTNLAFEHPDTLDFIAEDLGLTIYESAFFDRQWQDSEILRNPAVVNASFSEDVLLAGNNSEPLEIDDNRYMVLRVVEHNPEQRKPLAEVRERIITRIKFEKARDATRESGMQIVEQLKSGASMEEVAATNGFEWQPAASVKRTDPEIDTSIVNAAFRLGRPEADEPVIGGHSLPTGDYAVIIVESVRDLSLEELTEEQIASVEQRLLQMSAMDGWEFLLNDLKASAKVQVYMDNL